MKAWPSARRPTRPSGPGGAVDRRPFDTQDRSLDQTGRECLWPAGVCFRGEGRSGKQVFPGTDGLSARAVALPVQWFADPSGWER